MNHKSIGEAGERIAIGELAKFNIDILLPMTDNLSFDFVVYYNNKFYKCQVKSSFRLTKENSIYFSLTSNNWNKKTIKHYSKDEVDVFILCDGTNIYLLKYNELENLSSFTIRTTDTKNKQIKGVNFASNFILSEDRIKIIFD